MFQEKENTLLEFTEEMAKTAKESTSLEEQLNLELCQYKGTKMHPILTIILYTHLTWFLQILSTTSTMLVMCIHVFMSLTFFR